MKNLFSFNVTTEEQSYNRYIIKKTDSAVSDKQTDVLQKANKFQKRYSLPVLWQLLMYLCGLVAMIVIGGIINALADGTSFSQGYNNAPYLFYIGGACLIVCLTLFIISRCLSLTGKKAPEFRIIEQEINDVVESSFEDLGVPEGSAGISVIAYYFKINKKGKEMSAAPFMSYSPIEMKLYSDGDNLYLADINSVTAIPLSDIKQIVANKRRTPIPPRWTKDEPCNSPKYKPYKVISNQYAYYVKTYSMQICTDGEESEVLIPNYELETLKSFVGVPVIELK